MGFDRYDVNQSEMDKLFADGGPIQQKIYEASAPVEAYQIAHAVVDTGEMRDSVSTRRGHDEQGPYIDIGPDAVDDSGHPYPLDIEVGTSTMPPRPFIRPSVEELPRRIE